MVIMDVTEKQTQDDDEIAHKTLLARGRLSEAKKWFAHKGWKEPPQNVLEWGCDQAWTAAEVKGLHPRQALQKQKRSVRNWARSKAPRLTLVELEALVARTVTSNKRWSRDQSAAVLGIGVRDSQEHGFKFLGADDDPNYVNRNKAKAEKAAARARKYRAANGAKPRTVYEANSLSRTKPWEPDGISRRTWERRRKKADASASRPLNIIGSVTDLRHQSEPAAGSSEPGAPSAPAHTDWGDDVVDRVDDPEHAPFAVATGATKEPKMERRA
jgi:hypothetical protein